MGINWTYGQINFVLVFDKATSSLTPIEEIKSAISTHYGNDIKIAISQFPEITAILVPQSQVSILAESKKVQIVNGGVGELTGRDLAKFCHLTYSVFESFHSHNFEMKAYGLNYGLTLELTGTTLGSGKFLLNKLIKSSTGLSSKLGGTITSAIPGIIFTYHGDRYDMRFDPILGENLAQSNKILLTTNIHFNSTTLPVATNLESSVNDHLDKIKIHVRNLFNITR